MIRAAAGGATLVFAGLAAAHFFFSPTAAPPAYAAQLVQLNHRLDALQRSLDAMAIARTQPSPSRVATGDAVQPAASAALKPNAGEDADARSEALRESNEIVDRALQATHWTIDDVAKLATATTSLRGQDRAEIQARLSAAVNQDRLRVDPEAMAF